MKLKGAIFDLDGTLLDSMQVWDSLGEAYLIDKGIQPLPGINDVLRPLSLKQAAEYMIEFCGLKGTVDQIIAEVNQKIELQYYEVFVLKPGVPEFLEILKEKNIPMCIATATDRHLTEAVLTRLGVIEYFKVIFTCAEVNAGKDKPDIFLKALQELQTDLAGTYIFEDTLRAINTAKTAGFSVVGVYDETSSAQKEAIAATADLAIQSFNQLDVLGAIL